MHPQLLWELSAYLVMVHVFLLFFILFRSRYPRKKTYILADIGIGILILINGIGVGIYGEVVGKWFLLTCTAPSLLLFLLLSRDRNFKFLFTFCLVDTVSLWITAVTLLADHYLGGGRYILLFVSRLLVFPLLEYIAYRFLRKPYAELQDSMAKGWGIFTGMTLLYYIILAILLYIPTSIVHRPKDVLLCVLILVLMVFNYATMFAALHGQILFYRRQQNERLLQEQKRSLEVQLENQQYIRKMKHDMRGHIVTLSGLFAAGKTEEAARYLHSMESEIEVFQRNYCANPYLNAVFSYYMPKFKEMDGSLRLDIRVGEEALPCMELCRILSNGLENAYDAVAELDRGQRQASVQMKYNRDYLILRIKNCCRKDLYVEKGSIPKTEKKGEGHGFGLTSIQEAAVRLGGEMLCYTEKGNFVLDVMIRNYQEVWL